MKKKKQTDANVVEYLSAVSQFAEDNKTHKPKQQTAVEWLENELKKIPFIKPQDAFEQAKAMEKQRIEQSWVAALDYAITNVKGYNNLTSKDAFEQYYNETYNKE